MTITYKMLEVIKRIAKAKKEAKKACNQIDAYENDQQIRKFTDELVALYEEMVHSSEPTEDNYIYDLKKDTVIAVKKYAEISCINHLIIEARKIYYKDDLCSIPKSDYDIGFHFLKL